MAHGIRWGILGTGAIARKFTADLAHSPGAIVAAVGSRTADAAERFGAEFRIPRRHATYEALADDPGVDAVYVSTPHPVHLPNTLLCLRAGKAVLCEKPFALSAAQAREMVDLARSRRLFLMEAMWTRFLPVMVKVRELIAAGAIGEPRLLQADFGFRAEFDPASRLFDPHLGGGGLLDVGIYPLSLSSMVFGEPVSVQGAAHVGTSRVDEQAGIVLGHAGGGLSLLACGIRTTTPHGAEICGTEGRLRIRAPWWRGNAVTLVPEAERTSANPFSGETERTFEAPYPGNGYQFEADEVARCLGEGLAESPVMPLDETLSLMGTMDALRASWGIRYPGER
jgi:predicted dehydrogenase